MIYDVIIIGAGPAGLSAAIYAGRSGLSTLIFEKNIVGGQLSNIFEIENYPGTGEKIYGADLAVNMEVQATKTGALIEFSEVISLDTSKKIKKVTASSGEFLAKTIIFAVGAKPEKLGIENEQRLTGGGISYCATCDGAFFRGKDVMVVGGGNTAMDDVIFLSRMAKKVYLVHRRESFRAEKAKQERVFSLSNVEIIYNSVITKIEGGERLSAVILEDKNKEEKKINVEGLFIAVGTKPQTEFLKDVTKINAGGGIVTKEGLSAAEGIFVAGDCRENSKKQIIYAAADGALAATEALQYINEREW